MSATLAMSGAVNVFAGTVFVIVGLRFVLRRTSSDNQLANQAFAAYWTGLGLYTGIAGMLDVAAAFGFAPFPFFLAARYATIPLLVVSVASGAFYFLYLFSGRQAWIWPVVLFYSFVMVLTTFFVGDRAPYDVMVGEWRTDLLYARPYENGLFQVILLMLALPPVVGAAFYLRLARALPHGLDRFRVMFVATSILVWSAAAVLARLASGNDLLEFLSRPVLGSVAAMCVAFAYRPPQAFVDGLHDHERRRDALVQRAEQLI